MPGPKFYRRAVGALCEFKFMFYSYSIKIFSSHLAINFSAKRAFRIRCFSYYSVAFLSYFATGTYRLFGLINFCKTSRFAVFTGNRIGFYTNAFFLYTQNKSRQLFKQKPLSRLNKNSVRYVTATKTCVFDLSGRFFYFQPHVISKFSEWRKAGNLLTFSTPRRLIYLLTASA